MPSPTKSDASKSSSGSRVTHSTSGSNDSDQVVAVDENTNTRVYDRDTWVERVLPRLVELACSAVQTFKHFDEEAVRSNKSFDGSVEVTGIEEVFPEDVWLTAEQLGELCKVTGPGIKLEGFSEPRKILVRQCASGYEHAGAVGCVSQEIITAARPYFSRPRYAIHTSEGTFGGNGANISAPDFVVASWGVSGGGRAGDSPEAPLFMCEVERGNRTLPELIRHLGMLLANFPNLNAVVGIKGKEKAKVASLVAIAWRSIRGRRTACVTSLIDFGPDSLSNIERANAETAFRLQRPKVGHDAVADVNGAGVTQLLPAWERVPNGIEDDTGNEFMYEISADQLLVGAYSEEGEQLHVPTNLAPARINLADLVDVYF